MGCRSRRVAMCGSNTTSARLRWWSCFILNSSAARSPGSFATPGLTPTISGNFSERHNAGAPSQIRLRGKHRFRAKQVRARPQRDTPYDEKRRCRGVVVSDVRYDCCAPEATARRRPRAWPPQRQSSHLGVSDGPVTGIAVARAGKGVAP
jgi:hypothetical protein